MKFFSLLPLLFCASLSHAQATKLVDTLSFCGHKYAVPAGCTAESQYQSKCDDYSMAWLYMNEEMLLTMPEQFIGQMSTQLLEFKKEPAKCTLLGQEATGYRISFQKENGERGYQFVAYGNANGQPVFIQLVTPRELNKDAEIPAFAHKIIEMPK